MLWIKIVFLQVNKSARKLNQPFDKPRFFSLQPEFLKNIVRSEILLLIKTNKIADHPFVDCRSWQRGE